MFIFQRDERYNSVTLAEALDAEAQQQRTILILGGTGGKEYTCNYHL